MRVVIAEDMTLLREGLARLLAEAGFDVVGGAGDLAGLLALVNRTAPDVALIDIKMPPTHTDEGLQAATIIRQQYPGHRGAAALELPGIPLRILAAGKPPSEFWIPAQRTGL